MAWIESHQDLATNKKRVRLSALLKADKFCTVGILHFFWWWALDNAPTGKLDNISPEDIAGGIDWTQDATKLVKAWIAAGWIDGPAEYNGGPLDGYVIHDWWDYAGKLQAMRERNKERAKQYRHRHVTDTSQVRNGDVPGQPDPTEPDTTVHDPLMKAIADQYQQAFGRMIGSPMMAEELMQLAKEHGDKALFEAFRSAVKSGHRNGSPAYIRAILEREGKKPRKETPKGYTWDNIDFGDKPSA